MSLSFDRLLGRRQCVEATEEFTGWADPLCLPGPSRAAWNLVGSQGVRHYFTPLLTLPLMHLFGRVG